MKQRPKLNFQHLLYLQALVEERNVTRAAERIGITQSSMSTALARLREALNDALMVQTKHGMEPTPRALELARRSREISAILDGRGEPEESFILAESTALWRIMASDGIARAFMPPLMELAGQNAPRMRFTAHPGDPRRIHEYLRDGDFDLVMAFVRNPAPDLRQVVVVPQKLVCIARSDHPRISSEASVDDFLEESHVRWGGPPVDHPTLEVTVDEALERMGRARRISLLVSSQHVLPDVVAHSDLLAVVPEHVASSAKRYLSIQLVELPFEVPVVEISLIWHERMHHDPGHKWLRQTLADAGRRIPSAKSPL